MLRNILNLAAVITIATSPVLAQTGPKTGKNGGIGSSASTFSSGEPTGGTYSINGTTGAATFGSVTSSTPVAVTSGGTGANTAAAARTNLGLGTAATVNTGTSGATIPLLNGTNTWGADQNYSGVVNVGTSAFIDNRIELAGARVSDGLSFIDFHATPGTDQDARILRGSGANGDFIISNAGTGAIALSSAGGISSSNPITAPYFKPATPECANILHYGADRTGSAVSDSAWDAALAATQPGKQCIYLPAGEYKFSSARSVSISATYYRGSLTIRGDGSELTLLNFANNTTGIAITLNTEFQSFHVQDVAILAGGWSTTTTGLYAYQAATVSNPALSAASDITRVVVRGADGYSNEFGFFNGIGLSGVSNVGIFGGYISGPGNVTTKPAVCLDLSGRSETNGVVFNIVGATINSCGTGVRYGSSAEGLTVTATNFVANNRGIYVPPGATDAAMLTVVNSHFNNYTSSIDLQVDPGGVAISNNYFIVNTGLGNANGISIATTQDYAIVGNVFARQRPENTTTAILIGTYNTHSGIINGNAFQNMDTAINLATGSQRATVGINSFAPSVTTKVTNSGTNNIVATTCTAAPTSGFRVTNGVVTAC